MKTLKLIGAVGGAIALALCWPLAVGQIGQNVITNGLAHINNKDVSAELINYDRGYLSSHVQTRYKIINQSLKAQMQAEGLPTETVMESEVHHGLTAISAISTFPDYPEFPLVINSTTQLNGTTSYKAILADWHYQTKGADALAVSILASEIKGTVTALGEVTYDITVPSVAMKFSTGENVLFSDLTGDGKGKQESGFWIGKQNFALKGLTTDDSSGNTLFAAENTSYQFESTLDSAESRFTSNHKIQVGKLAGDGGEVKDLNINFTLGGVDSSSFLALSNIYQGNPNLNAEDIQKALPHIDALFSKGFSMTIDPLAFKMGEGDFSSKLNIQVPQGTEKVSQDPSVVQSALTGNVEAFVSNQLVADYPSIKQGVDELMVMELVAQNPDGYKLNADIKEGNLVFANGHKIPLIALFMSAMMSGGY